MAAGLSRARLYTFLFFLFSMPIFFLPWNTEYGYTKSIYTLVFISFILVLWAVEASLRKEVELELTQLFPIIPALILISFLSLSGGGPAGVVIQSVTHILYFGFVFLLVVNTVDDHPTLPLSALLAAGVLNALFGLLQYIGLVPGGPGTGLDAMISTMGNREYVAAFLAYLVFPTAILLRLRKFWALALSIVGWGFVVAMTLFTRQTGVRVGLLGGAFFFALASGLWQVEFGRWLTWTAWAGTTLAAVGVVIGWEGVLGLIGVGIVGLGLWALGRILRRFRWAWIPSGLVAILSLFLLIPPTTPFATIERLWEENSGRIRAWDWWVGYEMWKSFPVFGIGLGAYKLNFVPYKADFLATPRGGTYQFPIARAVQAHNEYVQVASELGTAGFLVLIAGIGAVALFGLRRVSTEKDHRKRLELLLLGAGLVAAFIHAGVSFPWHLPAPALAFVVTLGLAFSPRYGPVGGLPVRLKQNALRAVVASLVILSIVVSVIAVRDLIADQYLLSGKHALYLGNTSLAIDYLKRAVELDFCPRISLYELGKAQLQAGDFPAAQATFRNCLSRYGGEDLYINLASVNIELGEYAEARALLEELLATHPFRDMETGAGYLLAVIDLKQGNYPEAERKLTELLRIDPWFERALMLLGDIARGTYRYEAAREYYQRALKIIDDQLKRLKARAQQPLPVEEFGRIRSDLARLQRQREAIERGLRELP